MDVLDKLTLLGEEARYDLSCGACGTHANRKRDDLGKWIYPAALPDGRRVALLKVLQTNACTNDCYYCGTRRSGNFRRVAFSPDQLASTFDEMARRRQAEGIFLSSGIAGSATRSMDTMLATAELLRRRYQFRGYVHLKILPGASRAHVEQAMRLADRVSVNLESPKPDYLQRIAPDKRFSEDLLQIVRWVREFQRTGSGHLARVSQTTQLVVGATNEPDADILRTTSWLYRRLGLSRVYYSAFQPLPGTPLSEQPATPALREHRLYQCDFLLRRYGFSFDELVFDDCGFLPLSADPKTLWADAHPELFPVEINRASREQLLRVPGIGPKSADRLLRSRRFGAVRDLEDLRRLGAHTERAAPYVLLNGKRPPFQLCMRLPAWTSEGAAELAAPAVRAA